jgi:hypothetical protein
MRYLLPLLLLPLAATAQAQLWPRSRWRPPRSTGSDARERAASDKQQKQVQSFAKKMAPTVADVREAGHTA